MENTVEITPYNRITPDTRVYQDNPPRCANKWALLISIIAGLISFTGFFWLFLVLFTGDPLYDGRFVNTQCVEAQHNCPNGEYCPNVIKYCYEEAGIIYEKWLKDHRLSHSDGVKKFLNGDNLYSESGLSVDSIWVFYFLVFVIGLGTSVLISNGIYNRCRRVI